jgi:2-polyprenyl-3-methyl-5-hydroxy-6-metoxy-1,4-benzoquinol methylase
LSDPQTIEYAGEELDLFAHAVNWKAYFVRNLSGLIKGDVLEIGAGLGETTRALRAGAGVSYASWTCVEPDPALAVQITRNIQPAPEVIVGTLAQVPQGRKFDAILYVDVLEHIEDDASELALAAKYIKPGGRIVCLSPAYMYLYSDFDKAIHHFRRYTRRQYKAVTPASLVLEKTFYLDSLGCVLSMGNRFLLRQSVPKKSQILFWDRVIIPISRVLDVVTFRNFGRSVVGVWRAAGSE